MIFPDPNFHHDCFHTKISVFKYIYSSFDRSIKQTTVSSSESGLENRLSRGSEDGGKERKKQSSKQKQKESENRKKKGSENVLDDRGGLNGMEVKGK